MVNDTLDLFRHDAAQAGPDGRHPPVVRVWVDPATEVVMPWGQSWPFSGLDHLVMHRFLVAIDASGYAFVAAIRTRDVPPRLGAYACGGTRGWDTAIGEVWTFAGDRLEVQSRIGGDSDAARIPALTAVPNLLEPLNTGLLSAEQQRALQDHVDVLVSQFRRRQAAGHTPS